MIATYCVEGRWYYIEDATLVHAPPRMRFRQEFPRLWTGWIWVTEKKYHTDTTVTLFGITGPGPTTPLGFDKEKHEGSSIALEMRRKLTVKTLKDGPPVYIIQEQTLI